MPDRHLQFDAIIIGGGFYGSVIAIYLAKERGFKRVALIEQESNLLARASYNNQARVHNGYHYPRSFTTAHRSRMNSPRFLQDWPQAIHKNFIKLYAISRRSSKVNANQFMRFCKEIGAIIEPAPSQVHALFESRLIEKVFLTEEHAFNAKKIASWALTELNDCKVVTYINTRALSVHELDKDLGGGLNVLIKSDSGLEEVLSCRTLFNCTYSGLGQIGGDFGSPQTQLKQEITEMALIQVPSQLKNIGITIMDGPFFSLMPFPSRNLHTLSHVRYTPHLSWNDKLGIDPYQKLKQYPRESRVDRMLRDAGRYLPCILNANYVDSLFEVKTILVKNEIDDGRPILFERHHRLPNCYSVLGGKIDNVYDVLKILDDEVLI